MFFSSPSDYTGGVKIRLRLLIGFGVLCLVRAPALGDVTVTRSLKIASRTYGGKIEATSVVQVRGMSCRREIECYLQGAVAEHFKYPRKRITLISLDKNLVHNLDFPESTYQEYSLPTWQAYLSQRNLKTAPTSSTALRISQTWSRVLPDEGVKTILGFKCSKFVYEWRFEVENPETYAKKQYGVRTTLWLAEVSPGFQRVLQEEAAFNKTYQERMGESRLEGLNELTLEYAEMATGLDKEALFAGLSAGTARLKKIVGYPVASETEWFQVGAKPKKNKTLFTIKSGLESASIRSLGEDVFSTSTAAFDDLPDLHPDTFHKKTN